MSRIGLICPAVAGHMNPMTALGRELQRRGHDVIFIGPLDSQPQATAAGLGFCVIGEAEFPFGALGQRLARLGTLSGRAALRLHGGSLRPDNSHRAPRRSRCHQRLAY